MSETDTVEAVQAYIARLELEREKDGVTLRQADFESIAEELGLDAEARADLERRASEHMMRGEGFLSQELIADAVKSFEIARELQPWSLEPVKFLARSHAQGWKLEGETESRVASRLYCEQWIGRQPADKEPYSLMKSLKERADRKKIFRLASLFIGVGVVAAMAGIFTVKSFETLEGQVDQMRVRAELTQTPIQSTAATQEVSVELQVLESNSKLNGLELDLRGSKIGHLDFMEPLHLKLVLAEF